MDKHQLPPVQPPVEPWKAPPVQPPVEPWKAPPVQPPVEPWLHRIEDRTQFMAPW